MQHHITPCACELHRPKPYRPLSALLLQCWQRKYDQRPYNTLLLNRDLFKSSFDRTPDENDFDVLTQFLGDANEQPVDNFELNYVPLPPLVQCAQLLRIVARMTHVSLCHVDLSADHLHALLNGPIALHSLRLSGNQFTTGHASILREFLLHNSTLAYLDVGYCNIDPVLLATVADGMLHCSSLRAIDLSRLVQLHAYHTMDTSKTALIIAQLLWPNQLYEAHVKHNQLDGHDIVPIAECLQRCENLVYLDLGSNRLGPTGVRELFEALKSAPHLIGLDVSNNTLGEHGGEEIAARLAYTKLRYLDIGHNGIPPAAMRMILCTLKKRTPLRIFNIIGNLFDYTVGAALRRVLDARFLLVDAIDVKTTYDTVEGGFRLVPDVNVRAQYNQRYMRTQPFLRPYDVAPNLLWHDVNRRRLLVNGLYLDAIFVDDAGRVYSLDKRGQRTEVDNTRIYNF